MRMAYYPSSSAYPSWVKPVLVSIGAMFVASSAFLIILIWRSEPLAVGRTGTPAAAAVTAPTAGAVVAEPAPAPAEPAAAAAPAPATPAAAAPSAPGSAPAAPPAVAATPASDSHATIRLSHSHRRSHHRTHQSVARESHRKHHRHVDPLLELVN